ncbi:hypothetical protein CFOL_v3_19771 [Cephalotus follicularis]|uniref:Uncharacterized protein n=1 Tax=Cephalotus follicularis TaxID=3775 RepID=A0A1Q3C7M2_CEPFO|nr:hypothetical protein CFOL_v3_19771 [Cephalotus follicularis]
MLCQTSSKIGGTELTTCTCTGTRDRPSTLVSSRKKGTAASCKTCHGMPLVNGIGSISTSMMSAVGLELTNFINPDLTWKTVSKGSRSTMRRPRKPVSRNLCVGVELADKNGERVENYVSESEKQLGVDVLGRRFSDRIEHVPLKKRRTMFRSSSPPPPPPQTPSPHLEISEQQGRCQNSNDEQHHLVNNVGRKNSDVKNKKFGYFEDFSGIEILAAAACDDSIGDNMVPEELVQGVDSRVSVMPLEKAISFQDNSLAISDKSPCDKKDSSVDRSAVPLRDDRLHWDLNVAMDAWGRPCDSGTIDPERNVVEDTSLDRSEKVKILQDCGIHEGFEDIKHDMVIGPALSDIRGDICLLPELGALPLGTCGLDTDENKLEACSGADRNHNVSIPVVIDNAQGPSTCSGLYNNFTITRVPHEGRRTSPSVKEKTEDSVSGGQLGKMLCVESVQAGESDVASLSVLVPERVCREYESGVLNKDGEKSGREFGLQDDRSSGQDMMSVDSCQPPAPVSLEVEPVGKFKVGFITSSSKFEDMGATAVEDRPSVLVDGKGCTDKSPIALISEIDSPSHVGNCPTSISSKVSKDPFESDVSQDKKFHVGMENSVELQDGYDSQFEDGELREPYVHCLEENEGDGGDIEYVDYESEREEERLSGLETENNEKKMKTDKGLSAVFGNVMEKVERCGTGNVFGDASVNSNTRVSEVADGGKVNEHIVNCMDGPETKDFSSKVVGLRAPTQRNRYDFIDGLYTRTEKETRDGSELYVRGRSEFNSYRGPYGSGRFTPKSVTGSSRYIMDSDHTVSEAAGVAAFDSRVSRRYLGSSSSVYQPFMRKRSPANRGDLFGMQPPRDISPDRRRFRRYPQSVSRGSREEYPRSLPGDSTAFSNRMTHHLARRERSVSPFSGGRGSRHYQNHHYKKSQSRSRSRSPGSWLMPRDRNEGSRRRSRSPNFRSEVRMDRVRLPFQKRFVADYEDFMSAPRSRISPQHNSRWFDDRCSALDNFRGRKSPGGMLRQSQRFDAVRSIRRLNSDNYVRPMIHHRRFPDASGAGRGCKYEGSDDDRRRTGNRYEMINRVRRYDPDSAVRRCQYNAEDSFVANDS